MPNYEVTFTWKDGHSVKREISAAACPDVAVRLAASSVVGSTQADMIVAKKVEQPKRVRYVIEMDASYDGADTNARLLARGRDMARPYGHRNVRVIATTVVEDGIERSINCD